MAVIRDYAPLYRFGPMQARGPDATLRAGDRVKLTRKEMGYSLVLLEDGRTGYMANEDMAPAPPRPKPTPAPETAPSSPRRGSSSERYRGEQVNDSELPVEPPASLDLNVGPEDVVPPAPPPPPLDPEAQPQFRY
ncbi:MAG: hypothetical protein N2322_00385 [Terrimicrobiaceae bacterium]|nr:hypothetical protein [Terrimicrobiaceae bacterium]